MKTISLKKIRELVASGDDEAKTEYIILALFLRSLIDIEVEEI